MTKKKVKILKYIGKLAIRTLIINIPAFLILLILLLLKKLTWISAGISLLSFWGISAIIIFFVFKDLDNFIAYLKNASQNLDLELPRFKKGFFSSARLATTFQNVQSSWQQKTQSGVHILENLPDPILMVNEKEQVVFANASARRIWQENVIGFNISVLFSQLHFTKAFAELVHGHTQTALVEWQTTNGNKTFSFSVRMERLASPGFLNARFVIVLHDITPFQTFKQKQTDFLANASHELKTPLAILSGVIETLQGPAKDDAAAREKFLNLMAEQTSHMTRLVQNLLKLVHMQQEKFPQNEPVLMEELLTNLVNDFHLRAQKAGKKILLEKEKLPRLMANRSDLYHIFQNLLDNALKYGAPNQPITIKTFLKNSLTHPADLTFTDKNEWIVVSVHNFGKTLTVDEQEKLFDRFYRVNSGPKVEGTGLGLSIVQQLVQKYDGTITVESLPEKGITFTVAFPLEF
ncbi:MAG: ATP-binding protein [Alphaproteobacteria bacterium]